MGIRGPEVTRKKAPPGQAGFGIGEEPQTLVMELGGRSEGMPAALIDPDQVQEQQRRHREKQAGQQGLFDQEGE